MTEREYRSHPAISRSELWRMSESPEKFRYYKDHPQPPTPALLFGQVVHKLILQPKDFETDFLVRPDLNLRTKAGREELEELVRANPGKQIVSAQDYQTASDMANAVRSVPLVRDWLSFCATETPFFWTDSLTGEACKCRTDMLLEYTDGRVTIIDYKTCQSAEISAFNRSFFKYGYHLQAAMYSEGVIRSRGLTERPDFVFVAQEKTEPYSVNIVRVTEDVMDYGLDVFRNLIGTYHICKEMDVWPGYMGFDGQIAETVLPGWVEIESEEG